VGDCYVRSSLYLHPKNEDSHAAAYRSECIKGTLPGIRNAGINRLTSKEPAHTPYGGPDNQHAQEEEYLDCDLFHTSSPIREREVLKIV